VRYAGGGVLGVLALYFIATCSGGSPVAACPTPTPGSDQDAILQRARDGARFPLLYPCSLPGSQRLESSSVIGEAGRQQAEFVFAGAFDIAVRQSQFPPAIGPDPAGASRRTIDLFPNVRATLIEINDGSGDAQYHYFWERNGIYFEVQAVGPALQERAMRQVATSLQ
jgi:hypothetical protein